MDEKEIESLIEEEVLLIRHSGETPEIAYHSSLYFLFEDSDGPRLSRNQVDLLPLKRAVFDRYVKILLRDLKPENRDRRIYRGIARSIANLYRLKRFAEAERFSMDEVLSEARKHLLNFLFTELDDVKSGSRATCINCTFEELLQFAREIGLDTSQIPNEIEELCLKAC